MAKSGPVPTLRLGRPNLSPSRLGQWFLQGKFLNFSYCPNRPNLYIFNSKIGNIGNIGNISNMGNTGAREPVREMGGTVVRLGQLKKEAEMKNKRELKSAIRNVKLALRELKWVCDTPDISDDQCGSTAWLVEGDLMDAIESLKIFIKRNRASEIKKTKAAKS